MKNILNEFLLSDFEINKENFLKVKEEFINQFLSKEIDKKRFLFLCRMAQNQYLNKSTIKEHMIENLHQYKVASDNGLDLFHRDEEKFLKFTNEFCEFFEKIKLGKITSTLTRSSDAIIRLNVELIKIMVCEIMRVTGSFEDLGAYREKFLNAFSVSLLKFNYREFEDIPGFERYFKSSLKIDSYQDFLEKVPPYQNQFYLKSSVEGLFNPVTLGEKYSFITKAIERLILENDNDIGVFFKFIMDNYFSLLKDEDYEMKDDSDIHSSRIDFVRSLSDFCMEYCASSDSVKFILRAPFDIEYSFYFENFYQFADLSEEEKGKYVDPEVILQWVIEKKFDPFKDESAISLTYKSGLLKPEERLRILLELE